jgi:hypothetical protein
LFVTTKPMVQAYGGMNFYLGNRPAGTGMASARPGGEWDALEGEASRYGHGRNEQDAYYFLGRRGPIERTGAAVVVGLSRRHARDHRAAGGRYALSAAAFAGPNPAGRRGYRGHRRRSPLATLARCGDAGSDRRGGGRWRMREPMARRATSPRNGQ